MRILAVGDLHYSLLQFDWLVQQAPRYDAVIICGDLLDISSALDLDSQIVVVQRYLARLSSEGLLLVASGNHDGDVKTPSGEFVARWLQSGYGPRVLVDGQSADLGPVRLTLCPWWDGPETRAAMVTALAAARPAPGVSWVWIHHAPPLGSPVARTTKKDAGDPYLRDLILEFQPALVLSGHIHNAPFHAAGSWIDRLGPTWVLNPGRQIGPIPTHLVLDFALGHVAFSSLAGHEERLLTEA